MDVRKSLRPRNAIEVMVNGEDAGVVGEAFFGKDVESPYAVLRNRPTGRTISLYSNARRVLNRLHCHARVFAELAGSEGINGPMPVAVASDLVAARVYFSH